MNETQAIQKFRKQCIQDLTSKLLFLDKMKQNHFQHVENIKEHAIQELDSKLNQLWVQLLQILKQNFQQLRTIKIKQIVKYVDKHMKEQVQQAIVTTKLAIEKDLQQLNENYKFKRVLNRVIKGKIQDRISEIVEIIDDILEKNTLQIHINPENFKQLVGDPQDLVEIKAKIVEIQNESSSITNLHRQQTIQSAPLQTKQQQQPIQQQPIQRQKTQSIQKQTQQNHNQIQKQQSQKWLKSQKEQILQIQQENEIIPSISSISKQQKDQESSSKLKQALNQEKQKTQKSHKSQKRDISLFEAIQAYKLKKEEKIKNKIQKQIINTKLDDENWNKLRNLTKKKQQLLQLLG